MKTLLTLLAGLALFTSAASAQNIVLTGSFTRAGQRGKAQNLKATLTPDGAGQWKVVYDFVWSGKPLQYKGDIKGDLKNGAITGTAATSDGKRTWEIKGAAKYSVLTFEHWETTKGGRKATGDATLK